MQSKFRSISITRIIGTDLQTLSNGSRIPINSAQRFIKHCADDVECERNHIKLGIYPQSYQEWSDDWLSWRFTEIFMGFRAIFSSYRAYHHLGKLKLSEFIRAPEIFIHLKFSRFFLLIRYYFRFSPRLTRLEKNTFE